ncbi:MAG: methyltransferase domain-containing protein, partial [Nanoarchaeota archaeon]
MSHLTATLEEFEDFVRDRDLKGKTILDIGTSESGHKHFFEKFGLQWEGIDIKPHIKETQITQADMTTYNPEKRYDILFVCHSLEHCERPVDALRNFYKLLKDDGYLFISLPCYCD